MNKMQYTTITRHTMSRWWKNKIGSHRVRLKCTTKIHDWIIQNEHRVFSGWVFFPFASASVWSSIFILFRGLFQPTTNDDVTRIDMNLAVHFLRNGILPTIFWYNNWFIGIVYKIESLVYMHPKKCVKCCVEGEGKNQCVPVSKQNSQEIHNQRAFFFYF